MKKIDTLVNPKSVAIIGASEDSKKIGYQILNNIIEGGFSGNIFPVNPKGGEILGRKVFQNLSEINEAIDLAVIVIPSKFVVPVVKECASKKVGSIIIISAGFAETGGEGAKLQNEVKGICSEAGISLLGPNCLGLINTENNLNASFAQSMPKKGNISLVSQSGAMITGLIDWSNSSSVGFNKIFSMGNKADVSEETVLEYLYNDPTTKVIAVYLERLNVTPELTEIFNKYSNTKPTIVLFGGKTSFGAIAASSHTGSMISSYLAVETYLKQAGVLIANGISDLFSYCQIFADYQKISSGNIAIVTNAGGPAIVTCDSLYKQNLQLASLSEETKSKLKEVFRAEANINNPVDVLGDANEVDYKNALDILIQDENVDGIAVLLTPQTSTKIMETATVISDLKSDRPIVSVFIGGENLDEARKLIEKSGKPCFKNPEDAVLALSGLVRFNQNKSELVLTKESKEIYKDSEKIESLETFNLPILKYIEADSFESLKDAAEKIGFPVVLKTAKKEIVHKSDSGGVKLNLKNVDELKLAFEELGSPVIVGKMVKGDLELFLGIKKDPSIGTVVAFGTGGIFSELYKDISYRVSPLTKDVALEMISETKAGQILQGARGQAKYDLGKLADIIVNAGKFADNFENIKELDFNPVIASYPDFYIVDVRIIEG